MAEAANKIGKFGSRSVLTSLVGPSAAKKVDKTLRRKGFEPFENIEKKRGEKKEGERQQQEVIGKQKQAESLRLAEASDVVGRKRLLAKAGGRRSLISSR